MHLSKQKLIVSACVLAIGGCVTSHPFYSWSTTETVTSTTTSKESEVNHKTPMNVAGFVQAIPATESINQRVVGRLQVLGYLPLKRAYIHTSNGNSVYHPFFLWPVPHILQKTADAYPWNLKNPFIRGALIQFERYNDILYAKGISNGTLHKAVLERLFSGTAIKNTHSWRWVLVTKATGTKQPEELHLWEHKGGVGSWVWHTRINTGVLGATPDGTWPVYQRLPVTTMVGKFPVPISATRYKAGGNVGLFNGHPVYWQPYDDHGIKWVSYFDNGRGIHYYPRERYGFPQSAGCVEEPLATAPITYRLLRYGVPVTISSDTFNDKKVSNYAEKS